MLLQLVVSGIALGALYALVALSMTLVYRATTVVNFGHGDLVMAGAFAVYVLVLLVGIPYWAAVPLALVILFGFGVGIQRGLIRPIAYGPHIALVMMTIAVGYVIRGVARLVWGRDVMPMRKVLEIEPIMMGDIVVTGDDLVILAVVVLLTAVFFYVLYKTPAGKRIQALYQTERGAALVGINVSKFQGTIWGLGAAMGAIGGALIAPITLLYPDMGAHLLIKGFAAMSLGGFGSLWGAVIGGILLGVIEHTAGAYISTALIDISAYLIIIGVLIIRPTGILGYEATVRV